jgi:hypothetical protein
MHLNRTSAGFESRGAPNLARLKERWFGLLEGVVWQNTYEAVAAAWKESFGDGLPKTRSLIENGPTGRMILVTVGPGKTEQDLAGSLPGGNYVAFLKTRRNAFYDLDRWKEREFAHWLFAVDNEVSVSLLYTWSFESILKLTMAQMAGGTSARMPPPLIVPLEMIGGDAGGSRLMAELLQADAGAAKRQDGT